MSRPLRATLGSLRKTAFVYQIGGAWPLSRANAYIDCAWLYPGGIRRPIKGEGDGCTPPFIQLCDLTDTRVHLPQSARRVDFVVCIGVLPQVADPAWLWHQIQALAASGYVELPSRLWESTNRSRAFIGGEGHRWYAELQPEGWVFTQKATSLNLYPDAYFSLHELGAVQARLDESHSVLALRWEGPVSARTIRFESEAEELEEARAFKQRGLAVLRTHGRNGAGRGIWGEYTSQGLHRVPSLQSPTGIRRPANLPWGE